MAEHAAAMPVTVAIIAINTLVYLAMVARHVSPTSPNVEQLWRWGADYGPFAFGGQWWRVFTNVFLHIGIFHLIVNMWALWNLGALAERLFGRWLYGFIYLFCGVAGSLASLGWHPMITGAGASGAIFGLAGALIVTFRFGDLPIPRAIIRPILSTLIVFTVANVLFGLWTQFVDNAAHLGGLTAGLILGAVVIQPAFRGAGARTNRLLICVSLSLILAGAWGYVRKANFWSVHLQRSEEAMRQHKLDAGIDELKQVVAAKPKDAHFQLMLGRAYMQAKQWPAAKARLLRAAELAPKDPEIWSMLGGFYEMQDQAQPAYEAFSRVAALQPNSPEAHHDMGMAAVAAGDLKQGIVEMKRAIALRPTFAQAYTHLAQTYLALHDSDDALKTFQDMAKVMPRSVEAQLGLAQVYDAKGQDQDAVAVLKKAVQTTPQSPQLYIGLGVLSLKTRDYDGAIAAFQQVTKLAPTNAQAELALAAAYEAKGMHAEAAAARAKAQELQAAQQQQQQATRSKQ